MDYPNQNLQITMKRDAERAQRDHYLFGDTLNLMSPDHHISTRFQFKKYGAAVIGAVTRHN